MSNVSSCPSSVKPCRRRSKSACVIGAGLRCYNSAGATVWFTPQAVVVLSRAAPTGGFSDGAIQKSLKLAAAPPEGFVACVLMGLAVRVPDHTSRRQAQMAMPTQPKDQPLHLVVDGRG